MPARKVKIDEKKVAKLALLGCQTRTIARIIGMEESTLRRRCAALIKKKHAERKLNLLKAQQRLVDEGIPSAIIFLGKAVLGQTDKLTITGDKANPLHLFVHQYGDKKEG